MDIVDPDEVQGDAKHDVNAVPFFALVKNGSLVDSCAGADEALLTSLIEKNLS